MSPKPDFLVENLRGMCAFPTPYGRCDQSRELRDFCTACLAATEVERLRALASASASPNPEPPLNYVATLNGAKSIVHGSVLYRRFIDGTPLENDIAVWMADFATGAVKAHGKHVAAFLNELYAVMVDPCAEGTISVSEIKAALMAAAIRDREKEYLPASASPFTICSSCATDGPNPPNAATICRACVKEIRREYEDQIPVSASPGSGEGRLFSLKRAALMLIKSLPDELVEALRAEWGNTNLAVLKYWRDKLTAELSSLPASASPQANFDFENLREVLCNVSQIFNGWRPADEWSKWDEEVSQAVVAIQRAIEVPHV